MESVKEKKWMPIQIVICSKYYYYLGTYLYQSYDYVRVMFPHVMLTFWILIFVLCILCKNVYI